MKNKISLVLSVVLLLGALNTKAQKDNKPWSFGFGIEGGIPVGDARTIYDFNFGATARFSYHVGDGWATFTTGSVFMAPKNLDQGNNLRVGVQIPFKVGYKYKLIGPLFVMGEVGYSAYQFYYQDSYENTVHSNTGGFTYAPSVGITKGVFELTAKYESILVSGGSISHANLRLGFNF